MWLVRFQVDFLSPSLLILVPPVADHWFLAWTYLCFASPWGWICRLDFPSGLGSSCSLCRHCEVPTKVQAVAVLTWMSDCPLSASEIRSLITRLTDLEAWVASRESSAPSGVQQGYRQGGVADRGRVVPQSQKQVTVFPGIPQLAFGRKLEKEAVPDFKEAFGDLPARCLEGPGPVPKLAWRPSWLHQLGSERGNSEAPFGLFIRFSLPGLPWTRLLSFRVAWRCLSQLSIL